MTDVILYNYREQQNRPTAKEILCHPFLVSNEKQHCIKRKSRKKF